MITALLNEISNVLKKEFLFAALLPTVLFAVAIFVTFGTIVDFVPLMVWVEGQTTAEKAVLPAAAVFGLLVLAYVLTGIRSFLLRFWSGEVSLFLFAPILRIGEGFARMRRHRLVVKTNVNQPWSGQPTWFRDAAAVHWDISGKKSSPSCCKLDAAAKVIKALDHSMGVLTVQKRLKQTFLALAEAHDAKALKPLYKEIRAKLQAWTADERLTVNSHMWKLDRLYGPSEAIRATRLGNVIESYQTYSYQRYGMEPEIFWPHLQPFIKEDMKKMLENSRTVLDFAIAAASYALLCSAMFIFGGPWLTPSTSFWWTLTAVAGAVAILFYRLAVFAAYQFGDLFRASFDLYRLDLLAGLHREPPKTLDEERAKWRELSQLFVYGKSRDFELKLPMPGVTMSLPTVQR